MEVIVPVASMVLVILISVFLFYHFRKKQHQQVTPANDDENTNASDDDLELPLFSLSTLQNATDNFSMDNKLGDGGFGPVYKGVLENEQEIAVKRLAKTYTQGLHEFKNEVVSIFKLRHRNLVKLLGCCIEGDEKMLIYEYMPNKGLDSFIFDKTRSKLLDWPTRYHIIQGIARGLHYLQTDQRLRSVYKDLKVNNILLDADMNAKILVFGMGRTFRANQIDTNTKRVVDTYDYVAPEYTREGIFSRNLDVYSYGVLVLQIMCGEKTRGFVHKEHSDNLIGHAWKLHNEGSSLQLVSKCQGDPVNVSLVLRSIHIGLLCVAHQPEDRPGMPSVIMILESDGQIPAPKKPELYIAKAKKDSPESSSSYGTRSTNELTITMLNG